MNNRYTNSLALAGLLPIAIGVIACAPAIERENSSDHPSSDPILTDTSDHHTVSTDTTTVLTTLVVSTASTVLRATRPFRASTMRHSASAARRSA